MPSKTTLVCFAVKEEARPFGRYAEGAEHVRILVTGMGRNNAANAFQEALRTNRPELIITAGYAGGLNSDLPAGTILFRVTPDTNELQQRLEAAGARQGSFFCSEHVAVTVQEKRKLRETTGADAVEMESEEIERICQQQKMPVATVRVILDPANQDLPLNFNELVTRDMKMDPWKLGLKLAGSPRLIPRLIRFQKEAAAAAERLAQVLKAALIE